MVDVSEWSTLSWGLGAFQQCHLIPIIRSISEQSISIDHINNFLITNGQIAIIGVLIEPPKDVDIDEFHDTFEKNAKCITFQFHLHHQETTIHHELGNIYSIIGNSFGENRKMGRILMRRQDAGVFVWTESLMRISPRYYDCPLKLTATLSLDLNEGRQERLGNSLHSSMDAEERNVRMLLDVNRFRPTRIPSRELTVGVIISEPLLVQSRGREIDFQSSWLQIVVENKSRTKSLVITDVSVNIMSSVVCSYDEYLVLSECGSSLGSHQNRHSMVYATMATTSNTAPCGNGLSDTANSMEADNPTTRSATIKPSFSVPHERRPLQNAIVTADSGAIAHHIATSPQWANSHFHISSADVAGSVVEGSVSDGEGFYSNEIEKTIPSGMFRIQPVINTAPQQLTGSNENIFSAPVRIAPESSHSFLFRIHKTSSNGAVVCCFRTPFTLKYGVTDERDILTTADSAGQQTNGAEEFGSVFQTTQSYLYTDRIIWSMGCSAMSKVPRPTADFGVVTSSDRGEKFAEGRATADALLGHSATVLWTNANDAVQCGCPVFAQLQFFRQIEKIPQSSSSRFVDVDIDSNSSSIPASSATSKVPGNISGDSVLHLACTTAANELSVNPMAVTVGQVGELLVLEVCITNNSGSVMSDLLLFQDKIATDAHHQQKYLLLDNAIHIRSIDRKETIVARIRVLPIDRGILSIDSLCLVENASAYLALQAGSGSVAFPHAHLSTATTATTSLLTSANAAISIPVPRGVPSAGKISATREVSGGIATVSSLSSSPPISSAVSPSPALPAAFANPSSEDWPALPLHATNADSIGASQRAIPIVPRIIRLIHVHSIVIV